MRKSPSIHGSSPSMDSKYLPANGNGTAGSPKNGGADSSSPPNSAAKGNGSLKPVVKIAVASADNVLLNQSSDRGSQRSSPSKVKGGDNRMPKSKTPTVYDKWSSNEIEPGVRCNTLCKEGKLISTPIDSSEVKTAWDVFQHGLALSRKGNCLGWRTGDSYSWWTYEDVAERVRQLCAGFAKKLTTLKRQDFVGIYAGCVPQWVVCALACNARSFATVPLYDTLGPESCTYIINQVEMSVLFIDSPAAVGRILDAAKETPTLKTIISFQDLSADLLEKAKANNINLVTLADFVSGTDPKDTNVYELPTPDDICMIQYTSGTTGFPKGVIQTHKAYVANFTGCEHPFSVKIDPVLTMSPKDVCLQYLPLAHAYAQIVCTWFLYEGASIGFFGGNIMKLFEDATVLRPTYMPLVPRIMSRFYSRVVGEVGRTGLKAKMFWYCYERKKDLMHRGTITRDSVWDLIAFRRVQRLLGGQVRIMTVGSAPISAEVLEFWRVVFGSLIVEGYGQTECTAVATIAIGPAGGNVGHPLVCNYIKLADAPECGYLVKDGRGEVCIKGSNVMSGYYKQPDKTAEAIDADGWLHTGDIGEYLADGSLRIFDRKKHIFKLAQGEYIAPEKIENIYAMCPLVAQLFVDGSSLESYTVAVVVPDQAAATAWAKQNGINPETVMTNTDFMKYVIGEMIGVGKANKLNSLEQVKSIYLTADGFTPANGLLTPSMKNKRPELRRYFKDQIEAMYRAGPLLENGKSS